MVLRRMQDARDAVAALEARQRHDTPPSYVYRRDVASWVSVRELPAVDRDWLNRIVAQ